MYYTWVPLVLIEIALQVYFEIYFIFGVAEFTLIVS